MKTLRVEPKEVKTALDKGAKIVFLDVRGAPAWEAADTKILGAIRSTLDDVEARAKELPPDKEVVAYCT